MNKQKPIGFGQRVAFTIERGFKIHIKQSVSVSYRRATNGQKPKNEREQMRVN